MASLIPPSCQTLSRQEWLQELQEQLRKLHRSLLWDFLRTRLESQASELRRRADQEALKGSPLAQAYQLRAYQLESTLEWLQNGAIGELHQQISEEEPR